MKHTSLGDYILVGIGFVGLVGIVLFAGVLLSTLGGAFVGWTVGLIFRNTILEAARQIGFHNLEPWQLGAFFGFVGGFFRSSSSYKSKKE